MMEGAIDGFTVTAAEGVTRLVPGVLSLPRSGPVGLAVSGATAVLVGVAADALLDRETARLATAAAFSVPIKQVALQYAAPSLPVLSTALVPTLGSYPRRMRTNYGRLSPSRASATMGRYSRSAGALPSSNGRGFPYGQGYGAAGVQGYDYAAAGMLN